MPKQKTMPSRRSRSLAYGAHEELQHFIVLVKVLLEKPVKAPESAGQDGPCVGYFVNIGVSANSAERARALIEDEITDGHIDWPDSEWRGLSAFEEMVDSHVSEISTPQIWFESARIFFPASQIVTS